jgi:hypothetical protein
MPLQPNGWRCAALPGQATDAQMRRGRAGAELRRRAPTGTWRRAEGAGATPQAPNAPSLPGRRQRQHQRIVGWRRGVSRVPRSSVIRESRPVVEDGAVVPDCPYVRGPAPPNRVQILRSTREPTPGNTVPVEDVAALPDRPQV